MRQAGALFALLRIGTDPVRWIARGFAMGTSAHSISAARALQVHADAGAWVALALGLQVVTASLLTHLAAASLSLTGVSREKLHHNGVW